MKTLLRIYKIVLWPINGSGWWNRAFWLGVNIAMVGWVSGVLLHEINSLFLIAFAAFMGFDFSKLVHWELIENSLTDEDVMMAAGEARSVALTECLMLVEPHQKVLDSYNMHLYEDILALMDGRIKAVL